MCINTSNLEQSMTHLSRYRRLTFQSYNHENYQNTPVVTIQYYLPKNMNKFDNTCVLLPISNSHLTSNQHSCSVIKIKEEIDLHKVYRVLHTTLIKVQELQEKIWAVKKKYYFYRKLLDSLFNDMKSPGIVIVGCPQLTFKQLYMFFENLSRRLNIRFNDTNIELMLQNRGEWRSTDPLVNERVPILVKLKTLKIKNLYLTAVRKEFKLSQSLKKFGFSVHYGNELFKGIFVNEHLTHEKLLLYRFVHSESKKLGYQCFINNSKIYIRKSIYHRPIVVNSRHFLRVLNQKQYVHSLLHQKQ